MSELTERTKKTRQWVRKGERLRITIDVEVLSVDGRKANLKVIGDPTAECVSDDRVGSLSEES